MDPARPNQGRWLQLPTVAVAAEVALWALLGAQAISLAARLLAPLPTPEAIQPTQAPASSAEPATMAAAFGGGTGAAADWLAGAGIQLHGVSLAGDPDQSFAILATAEGRQGAFRQGQAVQPGISLELVAADHVVLSRSGSQARLDLVGRQRESADVAMPEAQPAQPLPATIDRQRLLAEAGLRPRLVGGRPAGYTVIARGGGQTLRDAGLQNGDVLLSVNGEELTPERLPELQSLVSARGDLVLAIERGAAQRTITLQLQ